MVDLFDGDARLFDDHENFKIHHSEDTSAERSTLEEVWPGTRRKTKPNLNQTPPVLDVSQGALASWSFYSVLRTEFSSSNLSTTTIYKVQ